MAPAATLLPRLTRWVRRAHIVSMRRPGEEGIEALMAGGGGPAHVRLVRLRMLVSS